MGCWSRQGGRNHEVQDSQCHCHGQSRRPPHWTRWPSALPPPCMLTPARQRSTWPAALGTGSSPGGGGGGGGVKGQGSGGKGQGIE